MKSNRLLATLLLMLVFVGAIQSYQPLTIVGDVVIDGPACEPILAGYDSPNMSVVLIQPSNQSTLMGTVNVTLNVTSVNGPVNLTLFVNGDIYPPYNRTEIGTGVVNVTVDTLQLPEGNLNFTFLFENETFTPVDRETYHLVFLVNNHGSPSLAIVAPGVDGVITGLTNLTLNVTSTYTQVYLNISIAGRLLPEYNKTLIFTGVNNYTINGSLYENGINRVNIVVTTPEGLTASVARNYTFLDNVRISTVGITSYSEIAGNAEIKMYVATPYPNVTLSAYVDDVLAFDVRNITLSAGTVTFTLNTTVYSEGEHNFTFIAYDAYGHHYTVRMVLVVNNHGVPTVSFVSTDQDIIVGYAPVTIKIESTWKQVNLTVFVDGVPVPGLINQTVAPGEFTFYIDTGAFSKWQHEMKVVVVTDENLTAEAKRLFGFASIRVEEVLSLAVLLGVAFAIPLLRWRKGQGLRTTLIVDLVFAVVVLALFYLIGVTSMALVYWHFNLASIWAIGLTLIFVNLILPLVEGPVNPQ
ncbi:MAG: hypothetical protein HXY34_05215 [Candidatus Thorarchaeota archaeon]|nr:hypothetical protein [Candidatus Thorarchaeota archaeon]